MFLRKKENVHQKVAAGLLLVAVTTEKGGRDNDADARLQRLTRRYGTRHARASGWSRLAVVLGGVGASRAPLLPTFAKPMCVSGPLHWSGHGLASLLVSRAARLHVA